MQRTAAEIGLARLYAQYGCLDAWLARAFHRQDLIGLLQCVGEAKGTKQAVHCVVRYRELPHCALSYHVFPNESLQFDKLMRIGRERMLLGNWRTYYCLACGAEVDPFLHGSGYCPWCHVAFYCGKDCMMRHQNDHDAFCRAVPAADLPLTPRRKCVLKLHELWNMRAVANLTLSPSDADHRALVHVVTEFLLQNTKEVVAYLVVPYFEDDPDSVLRAGFGYAHLSKAMRSHLADCFHLRFRTPNLIAHLVHKLFMTYGLQTPLVTLCAYNREALLARDLTVSKRRLSRALLLYSTPENALLSALEQEVRSNVQLLRPRSCGVSDETWLRFQFERHRRAVFDVILHRMAFPVATLLHNGVLVDKRYTSSHTACCAHRRFDCFRCL